MRYLLIFLLLIASPAWAGYKVTGNLEVTGNAGVGSSNPRSKLDVDGVVYATTYYGSGANLTNLPASMTYPSGSGVAVVNSGAWGTTLSTDGSGDCASGAVCLGDHTHSGYLTGVTADSPLSGSGTSGSHLTISTAGTWSGNSGTATALAANGTNCATGYYPKGVDASGNAESCVLIDSTVYQVAGSYLTSVTADSPLSGAGTSGSHLVLSTAGTWSGNAGTATALAANGTNCASGYYPKGVDASGNAESCILIDSTVYQTAGTYMTGATSNQGLAVSSTTLGIQDCAANQIMKRNAGDTAWECATDATGAGGGYTNLTEFVDQGNWKVFYSDGSGDVKELTTGASGYALTGTGVTSAPVWVDQSVYALDTDLAGYVPTSRTVNGKALSSNITLSQYDVDLSLYAKLVSPSFTTPTLGSATATTINKVTITAPATSSTLTIADGKTLTATNTVNLNTMTDGKYCTYTASGTALNCNSDAGSGLSGLTAGKVPKASSATAIVDSVIYENTNVGIGTTIPRAKLTVDGALYVGVDTAPTWGGIDLATAGDAFFKGDIEADGTIYTDATGDSFLNVTSGNVGIGTSVAPAQLTIDGTIYSINLTAGGSHGTAKALCLGVDGFIYGISSGACY